jgi:hypothetical protein
MKCMVDRPEPLPLLWSWSPLRSRYCQHTWVTRRQSTPSRGWHTRALVPSYHSLSHAPTLRFPLRAGRRVSDETVVVILELIALVGFIVWPARFSKGVPVAYACRYPGRSPLGHYLAPLAASRHRRGDGVAAALLSRGVRARVRVGDMTRFDDLLGPRRFDAVLCAGVLAAPPRRRRQGEAAGAGVEQALYSLDAKDVRP